MSQKAAMFARLIDVNTGQNDVFVIFDLEGDPILLKQAKQIPSECGGLLELPDCYTFYQYYIDEFCGDLSKVIELG